MAKRGPKPFVPGCRKLMPVHLIAREIGVSRRTVYNTLDTAVAKLQLATVRYFAGKLQGVR